MADQLDVPLEDPALREEVELVSTLMIAAGDNEGHLDQDAIDQLLGLKPDAPQQDAGSAETAPDGGTDQGKASAPLGVTPT